MATAHGGEPTDADFEAALAAVPESQWAMIWLTAGAVAREPEHLTWGGGQQTGVTVIDGVEHPSFQVPYAIYSDAVDRLRRALGALVVPFAWPDWDGLTRYRGGRGMAEAPVADAVRMITAVLRSERFSEGSIGGALDDGTLPAALDRVRRWYHERKAPFSS